MGRHGKRAARKRKGQVVKHPLDDLLLAVCARVTAKKKATRKYFAKGSAKT